MHHAGQCPVGELRLLFIDAGGIRDAMMGPSRSHGNRNGVVVMAMATAMANSSKFWRRGCIQKGLVSHLASRLPSLMFHPKFLAHAVSLLVYLQ
jgi:hypothetical protein